MMVTEYLLFSNFHREISMMISYSHSLSVYPTPGIVEEALSHLSSLLLKFFDIDQRTSSNRLAQIYMSNDDNVFGDNSKRLVLALLTFSSYYQAMR